MACRPVIYAALDSVEAFSRDTALATLEQLTNESRSAELLILAHKTPLLERLMQCYIQSIQARDLPLAKSFQSIITNYASCPDKYGATYMTEMLDAGLLEAAEAIFSDAHLSALYSEVLFICG